MAIDPDAVVAGIKKTTHQTFVAAAPRMLEHPPAAGPPFVSVHRSEVLAAVHRAWAQLDSSERERVAEAGATGSVRARIRARMTTAAAEAAIAAGQADRELLGDIIRAVDLLARRVDEIGQRLVQLERVVEDVVVVTGEDVTRIRAALSASVAPRSQSSTPPPAPPDG